MNTTQKITTRHILVLTGVVLSCVAYFSMFGPMLSLFIVPLTEAFAVTRAAASGIYTASAVASVVLSFFSFKILKHVPLRILSGTGGIICFLGCMLCAAASNMTTVLAGVAFCGIAGFTSGYLTGGVVISRWFLKGRGLATGLMTAGASIGSIILSPVISNIIQVRGVSVAFAVIGVIQLMVISFSGFFLIKDSPEICGVKAYGESIQINVCFESTESLPGMTLKQAKGTKFFYLVILMSFLVAFINQGLVSQQSALILDKGFSANQAAMVVSVYSVGALISKILFGWLTDRVGLRITCTCCGFGYAGACILILFGNTYGFALIYAILAGQFSAVTASYALLTNTFFFDRKEIGGIQGFSQAFSAVGGMLAPIIMGATYEKFGSYSNTIWVIAGLSVLFSLISVAVMKESNRYKEISA